MSRTRVAKYLMPLTALVAMMMAGCGHNEYGEPSFIHVDGMTLVVPQQNAVSTDTGFYTSNIVGAYITLKRAHANFEDTIGFYKFPFTAPLLCGEDVEFIEFSPAVPQSGRYDALPYYTYYKRVRIENPSLSIGDTLDFGTLHTTYDITMNDLMLFEPFEPSEASLKFDSVMQWERSNADEARSGSGYGYVYVPDTVQSVQFNCSRDFVAADPLKLLYLELDTRSDVEFEIYMYGSRISTSAPMEYSVMRVRPSDTWRHLYINLGRTWKEFGYNPEFNLHFLALNVDGKGGYVRLDNVKLVTTSKVL